MRALVVEDDVALGELLQRVLHEEGTSTTWVRTLAAARTALDASPQPDVVLLDWMLPDGDGTVLCEYLLERPSSPPVLMLTARGEVADRVRGLRSGADDYLVKPFVVEELLARLDGLVRRAAAGAEQRVGPLVLHRLTQRAFLGETSLDLTAKEFSLLARLAHDLDRPVERAALLLDVWGLSFDPGSGVLDVHVSRLRTKLGDEAWRVETMRGVGYRLRRER